ncbi:MAG: FtsQ-type POTRA domain-containing protein [Polyangiaceae bacterium]|jgi:cell division protein FtsQ
MAASVGLAASVRHYMTHSPRFSVADVRVTGCSHRSVDAVIAESGLSVGVNVFSIDLDEARAKIASDPWIEDVSLVRSLPATIVIHVRERVAAAIVALGDLMLATPDGEPFKRLESSDPVDLPVVTGLRPEGLAEDREGTVRAVRRAIGLAAEYSNGPLAARSPLEEVHVSRDGAFSIVVGKGALPISLGTPPFRRKLDEAARVMTELDKRGAHAGALLLDNDVHPERVVVRMK